MKKLFTKSVVLLTFAFTTMGITSCSSDDSMGYADIIAQILNQFFGQNGETYTYNLTTSKAQAYVGINEKGEYTNLTDETAFTNQQITLSCTQRGELIQGKLIFPTYNWESIQVNGLVIAGLTVTTTDGVSTLSLDKNNSTIDGTFTYEGQTYTAFDCNIEEAKVTTNDIYVKGNAFFTVIDAQGNADLTNYQQLNFEMQGKIATSAQ